MFDPVNDAHLKTIKQQALDWDTDRNTTDTSTGMRQAASYGWDTDPKMTITLPGRRPIRPEHGQRHDRHCDRNATDTPTGILQGRGSRQDRGHHATGTRRPGHDQDTDRNATNTLSMHRPGYESRHDGTPHDRNSTNKTRPGYTRPTLTGKYQDTDHTRPGH